MALRCTVQMWMAAALGPAYCNHNSPQPSCVCCSCSQHAGPIGLKRPAACSVPHCVQANQLIQGWHSVVAALPHCVATAGQNSAQLGTPDESMAEVQAACSGLVVQQQQLMQSWGPNTSLADRAEQTQQLVQPAARLGSMLVELDRSPALRKERQLVLARAAATRSCAYLGCANVAGQGGPAAGQGGGSARCR